MNKKLLITLLLVGSSTAVFGAGSGINNFVYSRATRYAVKREKEEQKAIAEEQRLAALKEDAKQKAPKNLHGRKQSYTEQQETTARLSGSNTPATRSNTPATRPNTPATRPTTPAVSSGYGSMPTSRPNSPADSLFSSRYSTYSTLSQYSEDRESCASLLSAGKSSTYQAPKPAPKRDTYYLVEDSQDNRYITPQTPKERAEQQAKAVRALQTEKNLRKQTKENITQLEDLFVAMKRLDIQDSRDLSLEEIINKVYTSKNPFSVAKQFRIIVENRVNGELEELSSQLSKDAVDEIESDFETLEISAKAKEILRQVKQTK
jgi:hypothetical protein